MCFYGACMNTPAVVHRPSNLLTEVSPAGDITHFSVCSNTHLKLTSQGGARGRWLCLHKPSHPKCLEYPAVGDRKVPHGSPKQPNCLQKYGGGRKTRCRRYYVDFKVCNFFTKWLVTSRDVGFRGPVGDGEAGTWGTSTARHSFPPSIPFQY